MTGPERVTLDPRGEPEPPCTGKCRGDRSAWEAPTQLVTYRDRKLVVCQCCSHALYADTIAEFEKKIAAGRLDPSVKATNAWLYHDDYCKYDVVLMNELVAS